MKLSHFAATLALAFGALTQVHAAPLVLGDNGEKLSKQNGAQPFDADTPLAALQQAAWVLGLPPAPATNVAEALRQWAGAWPA